MRNRSDAPRRRAAAFRRWPALLGQLFRFAFVAAGASLTLAPFAWLVLTSLKASAEVFQFPVTLWPARPLWSNYVRAVTVVPFGRGVLNTLLLVLPPLVIGLFFTALAAYAFARLRFPGREALFAVLLGSM